jgi:hypothetical protein
MTERMEAYASAMNVCVWLSKRADARVHAIRGSVDGILDSEIIAPLAQCTLSTSYTYVL